MQLGSIALWLPDNINRVALSCVSMSKSGFQTIQMLSELTRRSSTLLIAMAGGTVLATQWPTAIAFLYSCCC